MPKPAPIHNAPKPYKMRQLDDRQLDDRQLEILDKMGIDIWRLRQQSSGPVEQVNEQVGDVAEAHQKSAEPLIEAQRSEAGEPIQIEKQPALAVDVDSLDSLDTLDKVALEINQCQRCPLHATRIKAVSGVGSPHAQWMFVGEAPGQNEDQQGLPFVGRSGHLLDAMIGALRMQRADVFIANVIKCRPPDNRDPLEQEVAECESYLHRQLALIKPKVIVALGRVSAQALLKTSEPLGKLRTQVHYYGSSKTPMIITYHPAYLLRSPGQKSKVWEDLLLAKSVVDSV